MSDDIFLTHRQQRIMTAIRDSIETRGYPPTLREIAASAGLYSPSSVSWQLKSLEKKGLIRRDAVGSRGVVLVEKEEATAPDMDQLRRELAEARAEVDVLRQLVREHNLPMPGGDR